MANWKVTIDVSDIWEIYDEEENFQDFKEKLIPVLKSKIKEITRKIGENEAMEFESYIEEIENEVDDVEEFDYVWSNIYDWADYNKVWIITL